MVQKKEKFVTIISIPSISRIGRYDVMCFYSPDFSPNLSSKHINFCRASGSKTFERYETIELHFVELEKEKKVVVAVKAFPNITL